MLPLVRSCTCRLLSSPQFKILRPVVVADTIPVVNLLMAFERTPQNLLHDEAMFKDVGFLGARAGSLGRFRIP